MNLNSDPAGPDKDDFSFTEWDVQSAIGAAAEEVRGFQAALVDPDHPSHQMAQTSLPSLKRQLAALTAVPATEILKQLRTVHARFLELKKNGKLEDMDEIRKMKAEFTDLPDLHRLLRKKPWGDVLWQKLKAAQTSE